jgi:uncharacterized protein (TIGR03067 family)
MIRCLALLLFLALPVLAVDDPDPEPVNSSEIDLKKLQGAWDIVRVEEAGKNIADKAAGTVAVFKKDQVIIREPKRKRDEPATIKLDARKKPAHIDIIPDKGNKKEILRGIYKLTKDELIIVFAERGTQRPTKFDGGQGQVKLVFRRQKAK